MVARCGRSGPRACRSRFALLGQVARLMRERGSTFAMASQDYGRWRTLRRVIPAAPIPTPEVVQLRFKHRGRRLLAITVDAAAVDIDVWAGTDAQLSPPEERRLREALEVWQLVMSVESSETTRACWMGNGLDGRSPAEAIAADHAKDVMAVARYFVEAG